MEEVNMKKTNWFSVIVLVLVIGAALASLLASAKAPAILAIPIVGLFLLLVLIVRNWRI